MLRRRLLERLLFPALLAGACGGESSDLFDSSGSPASTGGDDSAGEGPEVTGGKAAGGSGGAVTPTGGRASAGAQNGGGEDGGEASGGVTGAGRAGSEGGSSAGGDDGGAVAGENQGGGASAGAPSGGVANGGSNQGGSAVAGSGGKVTGGNGPGGQTSCTDSDGGDQKVRGTTKGTNGTFEDKCVEGDLVEYSCEMKVMPGPCLAASMSSADADLRPAPPIDNCEVPTGKVIETNVDCGGRCEAGTCFYWCPTLTDEVRVSRRQAVGTEITNLRTEDVYSCEITYESENFDCRGTFQGETYPVFSAACDLDTVTIGIDSNDEPGVLLCSYSCTYE